MPLFYEVIHSYNLLITYMRPRLDLTGLVIGADMESRSVPILTSQPIMERVILRQAR